METQIKIWAQREKGALSLPGPGRYVNETYLKAVHRELGL